MMYSKGQMNAARLAGLSVEEFANKQASIVIDVKVDKQLTREEVKLELDKNGIEYNQKANTKFLNKLLEGK